MVLLWYTGIFFFLPVQFSSCIGVYHGTIDFIEKFLITNKIMNIGEEIVKRR